MTEFIKELKIINPNIFGDNDASYVIPLYQRAFAWEDKEISQLIEDINDFDGNSYCIGSLIVSKKDNAYEVIDGQQRLTALYLLLNSLGIKVENNLMFACREKSNYTLRNINNLLRENDVEESLLKGKIIIDRIIDEPSFDKKRFLSKLENVKIYRIEVPKNTDLNRYFEIMNIRGEQLEQSDILKAAFMRAITSAKKSALFATIWNACNDMTGYVQMHFDTSLRREIFGYDWQDEPHINFSAAFTRNVDKTANIKSIIEPKFKIDDVDGVTNDDSRIRFESVITFPFFLLHTLRVFIAEKNIQHKVKGQLLISEMLDDKKLLNAFYRVLENGKIGDKNISDMRENISLEFIKCLLKCRFLFDKYIVKREFINDNLDGEWSLKELKVSGKANNKKPYYTNTYFGEYKEWKETYAPRTKTNLMLQTCLRVSYTSPKVMHWITTLLEWLYDEENLCALKSFEQQIEGIAQEPVKKYITDGQYAQGVNTPHIVFNYLDYLLWKKQNATDFVFEFRNSVEHWHPQNASKGTFEQWTHNDGLDNFGNLCIIQRNINSKFSNLAPASKKETYKEAIEKGSLKLRKMASFNNWTKDTVKEHEVQMIELLKQGIDNYADK